MIQVKIFGLDFKNDIKSSIPLGSQKYFRRFSQKKYLAIKSS